MAYTSTLNKYSARMWRTWGYVGFIGFLLEWTTLWPWFATKASTAFYFSAPATFFLSPFIVTILIFQAYRVYSLWRDFPLNPTRSNLIELIIMTVGLISMAFSITAILLMTFGGPVLLAASWAPSLFFVGGLALVTLKRIFYDILPKCIMLARLAYQKASTQVNLEATKNNIKSFISNQAQVLPFFTAIVAGVLVCFTLPSLVAIPAWLTLTTVIIFGLVALRYAIFDYMSTDYSTMDKVSDVTSTLQGSPSTIADKDIKQRLNDILAIITLIQEDQKSRRVNNITAELISLIESNTAPLNRLETLVSFAQSSLTNGAHQSFPKLINLYKDILGLHKAINQLPLLPIETFVDRMIDINLEEVEKHSVDARTPLLAHDKHCIKLQLLDTLHSIYVRHFRATGGDDQVTLDGYRFRLKPETTVTLSSTEVGTLKNIQRVMQNLGCESIFDTIIAKFSTNFDVDAAYSEPEAKALDDMSRKVGSFTAVN